LRYLVLSDIHANLEALEKCLGVAKGKYDRVLCLGDLVGYGPDPNAAMERTREMANTVIRGNHDKACAGITDAEDFNALARASALWTRNELTPQNSAFLRSLPAGPVLLDGFELVHGSPADEDEYIAGPVQALPALRSLTLQTVFFGHTHHQGGFMLTRQGHLQSIRDSILRPGPGSSDPPSSDNDQRRVVLPLEDGFRYLVNPGSVGQPRDGDWRAAFAIFDESKRKVEYYRTPYDLSKTQEKMQKAGLPEPLILRLAIGR
jgi:predicted phosphodiesterase